MKICKNYQKNSLKLKLPVDFNWSTVFNPFKWNVPQIRMSIERFDLDNIVIVSLMRYVQIWIFIKSLSEHHFSSSGHLLLRFM